MNTNTKHKTTTRKPCQHLSGYWINRGINFRCYDCGHQLYIEDTKPNRERKIEVWKERW